MIVLQLLMALAMATIAEPNDDNAFAELRSALAEHPAIAHGDRKLDYRSCNRSGTGLDRNKRIALLTSCAASLGDGHTLINWDNLDAVPLRLAWFSDGIYVVDALPPHRDMIGHRVITIGNIPISNALERINPLISADNPDQASWRSPVYLSVLEFLSAHGLASNNKTLFGFVGVDDQKIERFLEGVPMARLLKNLNVIPPELQPYLPPDFTNWITFSSMRPELNDGPLYRRRHEEPYWMERLESVKALYLQYRYVRSGKPEPRVFADQVAEVLRLNPDWALIVDIRENPGGSSELSDPLADQIIALDKARPQGWLRVISGPPTFSAALKFLSRLELETSAVIVGGPSGSGPHHYGNTQSVPQKTLGVPLIRSTYFHRIGLPEDRRKAIRPDIMVDETYQDFSRWNDPLLAAALQN